jgi:hypothetical protein
MTESQGLGRGLGGGGGQGDAPHAEDSHADGASSLERQFHEQSGDVPRAARWTFDRRPTGRLAQGQGVRERPSAMQINGNCPLLPPVTSVTLLPMMED